MLLVEELLLCQKNYMYTTAIIISRTMCYMKAYCNVLVDLVICGKIPGNNSGNMCLAYVSFDLLKGFFLVMGRGLVLFAFCVTDMCRFVAMKEIFVTRKISLCSYVREHRMVF